MAKNKRQTTRSSATGRFVRVLDGVKHGFGQMASFEGVPSRRMSTHGRSDAQALKGDWDRLGVDFRRATDRVMNGSSR